MKRETVWRGRIVALEVLDDHWEVARHASAVAILVERADGFVLGVEQARPAVDRVTWELPAGLIDPGETPLQAAHRELREEGNLCGRLEPVARMFVSPGFTDEEVFLFDLHDATPCQGTPDETEALRIAWRDPATVWREAREGELATSAVTLLGLQIVLARRGGWV